jgi:hypothetical protein
MSNDTSIVYWHLLGPNGVTSVEKALARFGNERSHCAFSDLKENKAPLNRKRKSKDFFMVQGFKLIKMIMVKRTWKTVRDKRRK